MFEGSTEEHETKLDGINIIENRVAINYRKRSKHEDTQKRNISIMKRISIFIVTAFITLGGIGLTTMPANAEPIPILNHIKALDTYPSSSYLTQAPESSQSTAVAARTFRYSNNYWGTSRVEGSYTRSDGKVTSFNSGLLAVYMDYSTSIPEGATNIHIAWHRNGSAQAASTWDFKDLSQGNPTLSSSGTVFNPNIELSWVA